MSPRRSTVVVVALDSPDRRRPGGDAAIAVAGAALCVVAYAGTVAGSKAQNPALEGLARALVVAAPIGAGLYARRHPPSRRFGTLLIATGLAWFLATYAESSDPLLHAAGRITGWMTEPLLIYLVLAFPTGRLVARVDRQLLIAAVVIVAVLYLPTVLLIDRFPEPSPWSSCSAGCPDNPLMLPGSQPAWVDDVVRPLREVLVIAVFAAVCARLWSRLATSSRLMRRTLAPVLTVAIAHFAIFGALLLARWVAPDSQFVADAMWALALSVPLMVAGFLFGIARWHLFLSAASQHLAGRLAQHPGPGELQVALSETYDDPDLVIVYPSGEDGRWVSESGEPVTPPAPGSGRWLTEVPDDDRVIAGIVHDVTLAEEHAFLDSARAYAVLTLDNRRLGEEAATLLHEVRESRTRIQASADDERRRVERDLHDGAQQRLVALRIKLELAAERIDVSDQRSARLIRELGTEVDSALDEIRSLARGIYPSPLADRGLVEALRSAALQTVLPAAVKANNTRERYPRAIEAAAYFCGLEAMQNAAKHALLARSLVIVLTDNGVLQFEVFDDGEGFTPEAVEPGVGLTSMKDRLAAVGGQLHIVSAPGSGTRVVGRIPLDRPLPRFVYTEAEARRNGR
jgi:signal transduction histidine kinase